MHYLHSQVPKIIHRDLKSPNILVYLLYKGILLIHKLDNNLTAKISDFGLSKTKEHSKTQTNAEVMGTVPWTAPEYLTFSRIKERSEKGDVFSFGVIAWELVTRQSPWKSSKMSLRDVEQAVISGNRLEVPSDCPKLLKEMIQLCWKNGKQYIYLFLIIKDPNSRPSFETIIEALQSMKQEEEKQSDWTDSERRELDNLKKKLAQLKSQQ